MEIKKLKPYETFGGYHFFKHILSENATNTEENFDLLISYLARTYDRVMVDGQKLAVHVYFDNNETLFIDDHPDFKYCLFPITRREALARLWNLSELFWIKEEDYRLIIRINLNELFDDTYDIEEILSIRIVDTNISKLRRKITAFFKYIPSYINWRLPPKWTMFKRFRQYEPGSRTMI